MSDSTALVENLERLTAEISRLLPGLHNEYDYTPNSTLFSETGNIFPIKSIDS